MKKGTWLGLLLTFLCFADSYAKVSITEIMPNNVSTIVSDKYNYDGYVEFYNDGSAVDLQGWTVTNTKGDKAAQYQQQVNAATVDDERKRQEESYRIAQEGNQRKLAALRQRRSSLIMWAVLLQN